MHKETIDYYSFEKSLDNAQNLNYDFFLPFFKMVQNKDILKLNIQINETDPHSFLINQEADLSNILELNDYIDGDSSIIIKIEIIKRSGNIINIYNYDAFLDHLKSITLSQFLKIFPKNIANEKIILRFINKEDVTFSTYIFDTGPAKTYIDQKIIMDKFEIINSVSNSSSISTFSWLPEDFRVQNYSENVKDLVNIFNKVSSLLSIAYISDQSNIDNDCINYKITGYKNIINNLSMESKVENHDIIFNIYRWVFENGNGTVEDKIGLTRNILSRYLDNGVNELIIDEEIYSSIITSYNIYLKDNVEKYIETKNRVSELTSELSIKIKETNNLIINNFKNNNLTLLTFFVTIFVFNSLSSTGSTVFSIHTFLIALVVLTMSSFSLYLTHNQVEQDFELNEEYFKNVKSIYKDLFDENELNRLFNYDDFNKSKVLVDKTLKKYKDIWIFEIALLLLLTFFLTFIK